MKNNIFIFFSFIFILALVTNGCQKRDEDVTTTIEQTEYPDQEGWNSTVISTKKGILGAVIKYGHMRQFKKRKIVEFDESIVVDFYNEEGEHNSKLTSDQGWLDEATNNIEAFGNVVVVSDTGITLMTQRLRWDNSIEKIVTKDFVTIVTTEQDTFYGNGFESDQNLENWHITSFSGKTSKAFDLNFQLNKKKGRSDSNTTEKTADVTLKDSTVKIK